MGGERGSLEKKLQTQLRISTVRTQKSKTLGAGELPSVNKRNNPLKNVLESAGTAKD